MNADEAVKWLVYFPLGFAVGMIARQAVSIPRWVIKAILLAIIVLEILLVAARSAIEPRIVSF